MQWQGKVPVRDDFGRPIVGSFVDGKTTSGSWAIMSLESHRTHGVGLGTGRGQKYQLDFDTNIWLKVNG